MDPAIQMPPQDHDRLNGWKEIAAFLGKGVRTAQRWERELDLPVHRLGRDGGEIIVAFRSELTAWTIARDGGRPVGASVSTSLNGTASEGAGHAARVLWPVRLLAAAATALLVVVAALAAWVYAGRLDPTRQPASWRVVGKDLRVFGDGGELLWTYSFPSRLADSAYSVVGKYPKGSPAAIVDLDGDGSQEVALGLIPVDMRGPLQGIYVFNSDGTPRFDFRPASTVRFGSTEYHGPWLFHRLIVTNQADGPSVIWVVFVHGMEFPSVVVELDPAGHVRSEYWSNGFISEVVETSWRGRPVVMVGATNNDSRGASLAIFDRGGVSGSAPSNNPAYRCADCPAGGPLEFLLFPRRCIMRALEGQPAVSEAWHDEGGRLHVTVTEFSGYVSNFSAPVHYWFGPDLVPERAEVPGELLTLHQQMERTGYLDHPFGPADEADLFPVRRWNGSTFVDLPPAPVTR